MMAEVRWRLTTFFGVGSRVSLHRDDPVSLSFSIYMSDKEYLVWRMPFLAKVQRLYVLTGSIERRFSICHAALASALIS